ncbi:MAG: hypothetical protein AAFP90_04825 [Planctomycetota bacterium]
MRSPERRYRLFRCTLALVLVVVLVLIANDAFLRNASRYNVANRVSWLLNQSGRDDEIVIVGSSLLRQGINEQQLGDRLGTKRPILNLANNGSGIVEQALTLDLYLRQNQCRTVILELHPRGLERGNQPRPLETYNYLGHLGDETVKRHLAGHYGLATFLAMRWIPMAAMARYNSRAAWHDVHQWIRGSRFDPARRAADHANPDRQELVKQTAQHIDRDEVPVVDTRSVKQFRDLIATAQRHRVSIVAVVPPMFQLDDGSDTTAMTAASRKAYRDLLPPHTRVLRFNGSDWDRVEWFQDALHLSESGSREFSRRLADRMLDNRSF